MPPLVRREHISEARAGGQNSEFAAQWIPPAGAKEKTKYYVRLRKCFDLKNLAGNADLTIAAESYNRV